MRRKKAYNLYFPDNGKKRKFPWKLVGALILLAVLSVYGFIYSYFTDVTRGSDASIHFIDVGQGDSALIMTDEAFVLVDTGSESEYSDLKNYISNYTDTLDCVVFSHCHEDHIGGALQLLGDFEVKSVLMAEYVTEDDYVSKILGEIEEKNIKLENVILGKEYQYGDVFVRIYGPQYEDGEDNNNSLIMRATVDGKTVLFTGDAEDNEYLNIKNDYYGLPECDILKIGHHGSEDATNESLLENVRPDYAVISCGRNNAYGHPHNKVLDLLSQFNALTYRTDKNGNIVFVIKNGEMNVKCS